LAQNSNDNSCIFLYDMREVPNVGSNILRTFTLAKHLLYHIVTIFLFCQVLY